MSAAHAEAKRWLEYALAELSRRDYREAREAVERALENLRRLAPENG